MSGITIHLHCAAVSARASGSNGTEWVTLSFTGSADQADVSLFFEQKGDAAAFAARINNQDGVLAALVKLSNEVLGSLPLIEPLFRQELGNTNYGILIQRAEEARAAIAKATGGVR